MSPNALVAEPVDTTSTVSGLGVVESVSDLCEALRSGSWVAAGLAGVGAALDVAASVVDPLGSLIAAGLGWLMDHLEPLKGWLHDLTGDPGAVLGFARTWTNVGTAMDAASAELTRIVRADLEDMRGDSVDAYRTYAADLSRTIATTADSASAISSALQVCATVVQAVHDLVRDTLAQLVGSIISWAAEAVLTLGLATPVIIGQVATRVSQLATRIGKHVADVVHSGRSLGELLRSLKAALVAVVPRGRVSPTSRSGPTIPIRPPGVHQPRRHGGYRSPPRTDDYAARDQWAEETYRAMRVDTGLAESIASNLDGWDAPRVTQILKHLLHDEHPMVDYEAGRTVVRRFDPSAEQAEALMRLRSGTATGVDELLLHHEWVESEYLRTHPGAAYEEAHRAANAVADWYSAFLRGEH